MFSFVQGTTTLDDANVDRHLQAILATTHDYSWYTTEGLEKIGRTTKGSLPGDALGDVTFGFVASKVLAAVSVKMYEHNLEIRLQNISPSRFENAEEAQQPSEQTLSDISFVDDCAHFL